MTLMSVSVVTLKNLSLSPHGGEPVHLMWQTPTSSSLTTLQVSGPVLFLLLVNFTGIPFTKPTNNFDIYACRIYLTVYYNKLG